MSSLHHSFDVDIAEKYGLEEAIMIHHFQHWIRLNKRKKINLHEGRTWTYQTVQDIADNFPYWSLEEIRAILERLCTGKGRRSKKVIPDFDPVLIKGNFNKTSYDRTTWFAFVDEDEFLNNVYDREISQMEKGEIPKGERTSPAPIPDSKTDAKTTPPPKVPVPQDYSSMPLPQKGEGPLNPRRGGDRKSRMLETMREEFGDGFTPQQFEAAWTEMQATPASEVRNPERFLAHLLDKQMLCQGDPLPFQIDTKARDGRIEKHRQEAKLFASEWIIPSELTVFVKTFRGNCLIPYDLEDDEWQRMTRGFHEEVSK